MQHIQAVPKPTSTQMQNIASRKQLPYPDDRDDFLGDVPGLDGFHDLREQSAVIYQHRQTPVASASHHT